jgi:phage-related protein
LKVRFYLKVSGRSPVEEFLRDLMPELRGHFVDALLLFEKGLHELRLKDRTGAFRFFYYIKKGDAIFFIHAFKKKKQELPSKEIEIVRKRIKEV